MLPKKGSRRATVDGVVYRWRESHGHRTYELRVERFIETGQLLFVEFPYRHLDTTHPDRVYRPIMTNRLLCAVVECGLANGWTPISPGRLMTIDAVKAASLVQAYDYRYSKWTVRSGDRYL